MKYGINQALRILAVVCCVPFAAFAYEYFEDFNGAGKPAAPSGLVWIEDFDMWPSETWSSVAPGDGYAYLTFDSDNSNNRTTKTQPYQVIVLNDVGPGHRLEFRAKNTAVRGVGGFIFTYWEDGQGIDEIDIEIVPDDNFLDGGYDHTPNGLLPPNGYTDARFNTWGNTPVNTLTGRKRSLIDADGNKVSHMDSRFHTYTIEWLHGPQYAPNPKNDGRDGRLDFYVDGIHYYTFYWPIPDSPAGVILGYRHMPSWTGTLGFPGLETMVIDWLDVSPMVDTGIEAYADQYSVTGGVLNVTAAAGVLANDQGSGLSAVHLGEPENGQVLLNPDGSFSYVADPGFAGIDSFAYRATDGTATGESQAVEVRINVLPLKDAGWILLTEDDFESGWGNFVSGGANAVLDSSGYAHGGTTCVQINDDLVPASSFEWASGVDLTAYDYVSVEFWAQGRSMDNANDDYFVQFYDGTTWQTVATHAPTRQFVNGPYYYHQIIIDRNRYTFPSNAKIRFMGGGGGSADWVYIDDVRVSAAQALIVNGEFNRGAQGVVGSVSIPGWQYSGSGAHIHALENRVFYGQALRIWDDAFTAYQDIPVQGDATYALRTRMASFSHSSPLVDRTGEFSLEWYDSSNMASPLASEIVAEFVPGVDAFDEWHNKSAWVVSPANADTMRIAFTVNDGASPSGNFHVDQVGVSFVGPGTVSQLPVADAGLNQQVPDTDGINGEDVVLDGSASYDPDGTITNYVWREGAVVVATGVNPTHRFSDGTHQVDLTVTDNSGLDSLADRVEITVVAYVNTPPVADAGGNRAVFDSDGLPGEGVLLDGSASSDANGDITSYVWRDGGNVIASGTNQTANLSDGQHIVDLIVTDDEGDSDTNSVSIMVVNHDAVFFDDFEDGNFSGRAQSDTDNAPWTLSHTTRVNLVPRDSFSLNAARIRRSNNMYVSFSTLGFYNLEVCYDRLLSSDSGGAASTVGVDLDVLYSLDGSSWTNGIGGFESIGAESSLGWENRILTLPAGLDNQSAVYIQFKTTSYANSNYEQARLDNIIVKGKKDSDGDNMPDSWEITYGLNPTNGTDAATDKDDDGMNNGDEYIAGTNPDDDESLLVITEADPVSNVFQLGWASASNRIYSILESSNLVDWAMISSNIPASPPENRENIALTNGPAFYQIEVEME